MNTFSKQIKVYVENESKVFNYIFTPSSIFEDLLEFTAYYFPELNLCPCFKFINPNKKNDLNKDTKIAEYISKNSVFQLVNSFQDKQCHCNSLYKLNYKRPKIELLKLLEQKISDGLDKEKKDLASQEFEKEKNELKQKINSLELQNADLKKKLNLLEAEGNKKTEDLEKKFNDEKAQLEKKIQLLEVAVNGDGETINQLRQLGILNENIKEKGNNNIKIDPTTNSIIGNAKPLVDPVFINFYDVIIDIKSIKDICQGWEVKLSERAKKCYEEFKQERIIKIGVIGNSNKGKSFLLSKISKIDLPSGTSIRTEGISIKYPELDLYKDRKIALLDSAGLETPVLKEENKEGAEEKQAKKEEKSEAEDKEKVSKEETEEEKETEEKNEKELFKEKSREKIITELFLQNYIINNSDILLVVVGILTYSEQKLLNRIKTEIQRAKINKTLFIIHNLITYTTIQQVQDYINNFLLKSATFNLEEGHKISTKTQTKSGSYYYEKNTDPKIYHLIFANEGSEAGKYYNNFTLDFLEGDFQRVTDLKPFDVINTVKERFIEVSKDILEKTDNPFSIKDFDNTQNNSIKLKNHNVTLKKCLIDELGFSNLKANGFEPVYNYYKKGDKVVIRVEAPGNSSIKSSVDSAGEYKIIRLTGIKKRDKEPAKLEENIFNSRESGNFSLDIPLKNEDFLIKNEPPTICEKKGVLILEFQLDHKKEDGGYEVEDEI